MQLELLNEQGQATSKVDAPDTVFGRDYNERKYFGDGAGIAVRKGEEALRDGFSATRFWNDVRESGATYFAYMGAVIHLLWAQPERPDDADNAVRRAFGAAAPAAIVEAFERRFGLDEQEPATLDALAVELSLTRERVRQIQQDALARLKRALTAGGIGRDAVL